MILESSHYIGFLLLPALMLESKVQFKTRIKTLPQINSQNQNEDYINAGSFCRIF